VHARASDPAPSVGGSGLQEGGQQTLQRSVEDALNHAEE